MGLWGLAGDLAGRGKGGAVVMSAGRLGLVMGGTWPAWPVLRAESRVRVTSASSRPAWRAAAAKGLRSAAGSASSGTVGSPRTGPRCGCLAAGHPPGQVAQIAIGGGVRLGPLGRPQWFQQGGNRGPVQSAVGLPCPDDPVGLAVNPGWRGQDVAAAGPEVQVMGGQVAVALARSCSLRRAVPLASRASRKRTSSI